MLQNRFLRMNYCDISRCPEKCDNASSRPDDFVHWFIDWIFYLTYDGHRVYTVLYTRLGFNHAQLPFLCGEEGEGETNPAKLGEDLNMICFFATKDMLKIHDSRAGWGHHIKAFVGVGHGKHSRWLAVVSKGPLKGLGHRQEYSTLGCNDFLGHGNPHYTTVFFLFFSWFTCSKCKLTFPKLPPSHTRWGGGGYETHQSLNKAGYWILVCRGEWLKPSKCYFFVWWHLR